MGSRVVTGVAVAAIVGVGATAAALAGPQRFSLGASEAHADPAVTPSPAADPGREAPAGRVEEAEHRPGPAPDRTIELVFTGDVLLHTSVYDVALAGGDDVAGFVDMFAPVADVVSAADLAICHLEVPLSADGTGLAGYPAFRGPPGVAEALVRTGYDGCSTASNHSMDHGPSAIADTLDVMDAAGLGHAGMSRTEAEAYEPRLYDVDGITVGNVSATYGLNGIPLPADRPWVVDLNTDIHHVLRRAADTRAAGADVVVVSMHWGDEYVTEPTALQRDQAAALLASPDVDLVVGHHAHVVQPVERVGDKAVVYGLGNFLSGQQGRHTAGTQDGIIVHVDVRVPADGGPLVDDIRYTPTWVEPGSYRVLPVVDELGDPGVTGDRRAALEASLARTTAAVGPDARLAGP